MTALIFGSDLVKKVVETDQNSAAVIEKIKRCHDGAKELAAALGLDDPEQAAKWHETLRKIRQGEQLLDAVGQELDAIEDYIQDLRAVRGDSTQNKQKITTKVVELMQDLDVSTLYDLIQSLMKVFGNLDLVRRISESHYDLLEGERQEADDVGFAETRSEVMDLLLAHARQQANGEVSSDASVQKELRNVKDQLRLAEKNLSRETARADREARARRKSEESARLAAAQASTDKQDLIQGYKDQLQQKAEEAQALSEEVAKWQNKAENLSGLTGIREKLTQRLNEIGQPDSQAFDDDSPSHGHDERISELEAELSIVKVNLEKSKRELTATNREHALKCAEAKRATVSVERLKLRYNDVLDKLRDAQFKLQEQTDLCEEQTKKVTGHWTALMSTRGHLQDAKALVEQLKQDKAALRDHNARVSDQERDALKKKVSECKARLVDRTGKISQLERDLKEMKSDLNEARTEAAEMKAVVEASETHLQAARKEETRLAEEVVEIRQELQDEVKAKDSLAAQVVDLQRTNRLLKKQKDDLDDNIADLQDDLAKANLCTKSAEDAAAAQARELEGQCSRYRRERNDSRGQVKALKQELSDAAEKHRVSSEVESQLRGEILTVRSLHSTSVLAEKFTQNRLWASESKVNSHERQLSRALGTQSRLESEKSLLGAQLAQSQGLRTRLESEKGRLESDRDLLKRQLSESGEAMARAVKNTIAFCGHDSIGRCLVNGMPAHAGAGAFGPWKQLAPWTQDRDGPQHGMPTRTFGSTLCELGTLLDAHPDRRQGEVRELLAALVPLLVDSREVMPSLVVSVLELVVTQYDSCMATLFEAWQVASVLDERWRVSSVELLMERAVLPPSVWRMFERMAGDTAALLAWCTSQPSAVYDAATDRILLASDEEANCIMVDLRNRQVRWGGSVTYDGFEVQVQGHDTQDCLVMPLKADWGRFALYMR